MAEWKPVHDGIGKVVGWTMPPGPDGRYPEDTIPAILETRDGDPVGTARLGVDYFGVVDPEMVPQEFLDAELMAWWEE